jgi:NTE family protein
LQQADSDANRNHDERPADAVAMTSVADGWGQAMNDPALVKALNPVRAIPGDDRRPPEQGLALCLSGGGYRAMVFHVGVLWRLNEVGLLPTIKRFSSVSGGSITAGVLAMNWGKLAFDDHGVAANFVSGVVDPLRGMASTRVDVSAILSGALLPGTSISDRVASTYRRHLFGRTTLQDLPDQPRFVFNATNLESGVLMRFSKPYLADYRVGRIANPELDLAVAVAASSAFPPVLSPFVLRLKGQTWVTEKPGEEPDLVGPRFRDEITLSDGGVYDNLGLETAWKKYKSILVSDAGGHFAEESDPAIDWARQTYRVLNLVDNQVRSLRKRQVVGSLRDGVRDGMYVGIRSVVANDFPKAVLPADEDRTRDLAEVPTRLDAMKPILQEQLINWGYAACDGGLRSYFMRGELDGVPATPLPYPAQPLT